MYIGRLVSAIAMVGALLSALLLGPLSASAQTTPSQSSSFQVQNLSSTTAANIQISFYNQDGSLASMDTGFSNPQADTVAAGGSNTYFGTTLHVASGFNGSVVISSDQQIAVVSNLIIATTAAALDSYAGFNSGGTAITFPQLQHLNSGNNSTFNVQNTSSTAVTVNITFTPQPGGGYPSVPAINGKTIAPGAALTISQGPEAGSPFASVSKWVGSALVSVQTPSDGSGTIAGVANIINSSNAAAYRLTTYDAFTSGATTVLAPLIQEANNNNRTSLNCANLDPSQTVTINVSYSPAAGISTTKASQSVANVVPNGLAVFLQQSSGVAKFVGSATVTATPSVPLACVVNQT